MTILAEWFVFATTSIRRSVICISVAGGVMLPACGVPDKPNADRVISLPNDDSFHAKDKTHGAPPDQLKLLSQANDIITQLTGKQYDKITPHIHPTKGVRFSMYAYVNPDKDKVFSQAEFDKYLNQSKVQFTWGEKDGTGDLYIVSLPTYLANWVVRDTRFEKVGVNEFYGTGNSLNNLADVYPEHEFVEFYSAGSETYAGMDWRCVRLVFETYQGRPYLVAIITDEWTI